MYLYRARCSFASEDTTRCIYFLSHKGMSEVIGAILMLEDVANIESIEMITEEAIIDRENNESN